MDRKVEVEEAKGFLQGRRPDNAVLASRHVTHFEVDLSADGVEFFDNSEQSECIPLCMVVHSVSESADLSKCKRILLKTRNPTIIGVAHCQLQLQNQTRCKKVPFSFDWRIEATGSKQS